MYPLVAQTVTFTDLSENIPTSWAWSFSPATFTYVGGTTASSQNPQVEFSALGQYTVTLTATNAYGSDTEIKTNYTTVTNCTFTTLPFTESFSGTTIPNCWSQVDYIGAGKVWQFGVIANTAPPLLTGNYAYLNSDAYGSGVTENADLVSPTLDLSGYTNITLQFNHYFKYYSTSAGTVSYSINGGSTWTQIQQFTGSSTANPAVFNQVIADVAGQSQVKFKWNYTGTWGYWWAIDDVSITGASSGPTLSVAPANQNVTAPAGTTTFTVTSNATWTAASDQTWCTVNPTGTGNGIITATYAQNTNPGGRAANITVNVSGISPVIVTVTQAGTLTPTLAVTPPNQNVAAPAGTTPFTVTSNSPWTVASNQSWCTVTPSGTGNGAITATYSENLLTTSRVANVTVTVIGLPDVVVTVTQAGAAQCFPLLRRTKM
jgi:PKD repeat protein